MDANEQGGNGLPHRMYSDQITCSVCTELVPVVQNYIQGIHRTAECPLLEFGRGRTTEAVSRLHCERRGQLAMPIKNNTRSQTIRLYPGERFCQIVFESLSSPADIRKSRYHHKDIIEGFISRNDNVSKNSDEDTEATLIMSGDIKKLKSEHSITHENQNQKA